MNLVSALLYWVAVAIWLTVLCTVVFNYLRNPRGFGATRLLLMVVVIDTVRNVVENVYFGSYWGGQFGLFDPEVVGFLGNPILMMVPKALNIVAGSFVLGVLVLRWLPESIRERAASEQRFASLEREANAFAVVMDRTSMPILVLDAQQPGRPVVFANRAYLAAWNYKPEDVIGKIWTYREAINPAGPEVADLHGAISDLRQTLVVVPCRKADGTTYNGRISVTPIVGGGGRITLVTVMCEGAEPELPSAANANTPPAVITAASAAAANARDSLVGKMAGSVAHDFNNLLSVMLSSLEDARHMMAPGSPATRAVDLTVRAAQRSSLLARRLMDYSRNRAADSDHVDLVEVIENLQPLLARAVTARMRLELHLPSGPVMARLDPGRLEDALMNLCLNARDASPDGGSVRIVLRIENTHAVITVTDTGQGMAPEVLAHALDRNFTTKPEGKGSGLGLASVQEFVQDAGGEIKLESKPGRGTRVYLRLPLASGSAAA